MQRIKSSKSAPKLCIAVFNKGVLILILTNRNSYRKKKRKENWKEKCDLRRNKRDKKKMKNTNL